MDDEHPVVLNSGSKRKVKRVTEGHKTCIIHCTNTVDQTVTSLTQTTAEKIKETARLRQGSEVPSLRFDHICHCIPEEFNLRAHGFHRNCYKKFTNLKYLRKRKSDSGQTLTGGSAKCEVEIGACGDGPPPLKQRRLNIHADTVETMHCIFCSKDRKTTHSRGERTYEKLSRCLKKAALESIRAKALSSQDTGILDRIQDENANLVYHESCRKHYLRAPSKQRHNRKVDEENLQMKQAHEEVFELLCTYIETHIIHGSQVERMTMLKNWYLQHLEQQYPKFFNPGYKTDKLKVKIKRKFGDKIKFWTPDSGSDIVYSDKVPLGKAVETAFTATSSNQRKLDDAAQVLRQNITDAFEASTEMPWPPSADFLQSDAISPPPILVTFLQKLIGGKKSVTGRLRLNRVAASISQDICYAVTSGRWRMPKHLLIGMTVRHLTGSAEVVTLLNRHGHSVSYDILREVETAMANQVLHSQQILPATIDVTNNRVLHFAWDNFDLNEETPSGSNTTHSTHGIVLQEVARQQTQPTSTTPIPAIDQRTRRKSITYEPKELPPCFTKKVAEPQLDVKDTHFESPDVVHSACASDFWWMFARNSTPGEDQKTPCWAGWVSLTGEQTPGQVQKTTLEYMPPVLHPITDDATVQHVLDVSQRATSEVGQKVTLVTMDLAAAKKAYNIVWQTPIFRSILVRVGVFHTVCSYLGAVGKIMRGTGWAEIVVQSGICASGAIEPVISGKHYNRSLKTHKRMLEAVERLVFQKFQEDGEVQSLLQDTREKADCLQTNPGKDKLQEVKEDRSCRKLFQRYLQFKDAAKRGALGKTAILWLQYADRIWLILRFLRATKENNLDLHLACLQEMCPLMFAMDHQNYAKYLSVYFLLLLNAKHSDTLAGADQLLRDGGLSVRRSEVPTCGIPVDQAEEQSVNRHAKSNAGVIGISRNYAAYYRWSVSRSLRASYVAAALLLAGMLDEEGDSHKDVRLSEVKKSEEDVQKVMESFRNFANPFETDDADKLFSLASGVPAPPEVESALLNAESTGKTAFYKFVQERLVQRSKSFHETLTKTGMKTFTSLEKKQKICSSTAKKSVEIRAQRNIFGQLLLLSIEHKISVEKVMAYPMSPVPWALATADGMPMKTEKSKLMHVLEKPTNSEEPRPDHCTHIVDGNGVLQSLVGLPGTFAELSRKVMSQLPKSSRVDFVTDTYPEQSIKASERARRGTSATFMVKGPATKIPKDWKGFLSNGENKTQTMKLILSEWTKDTYAQQLKGRTIYFTTGIICTRIFSPDGKKVLSEEVPELSSTQEEADTRMVLHCCHQATSDQSSETEGIIVRSTDTDVFVLLLYHQRYINKKLYLDTGMGDKRRLINITCLSEMHGPEMCEAVVGLHAFTGCDSASSFVRKGKISVWKTLRKHPRHIHTFQSFGCLNIEREMHTAAEQFVCCLYGRPRYTDINQLRHDLCCEKYQIVGDQILSDSDGTDLSLLPPCRSSLQLHTNRANYQALIWKTAHISQPELPSPVGRGWVLSNNSLNIQWTDGNILPQKLVDILCEVGGVPEPKETDNMTHLVSLVDVFHENEEAEEDDE